MPIRKTLLTVPYSQVNAANELAQSLQQESNGTDGGQFTFTVPIFSVSARDDLDIISYWSAPILNDADHANVQAQLVNFPGATMEDYDPIANPGFPDQWLAANNLRRALPKLP